MDLTQQLRRGEYVVYLIVLLLTALLLVLSLYLAFYRIYQLTTASVQHPDDLAILIYNALSDIFLVIVFTELIDTFITYVEQKKVVVYKIIDVALVALARELFIYMAPINKEFNIDKAVAIIAATLVVGLVDYLQRKALGRERR
ncbi:MAG: phosphate-starvation-inducible PsiE family protein [Pyrobaculum sp.]